MQDIAGWFPAQTDKKGEGDSIQTFVALINWDFHRLGPSQWRRADGAGMFQMATGFLTWWFNALALGGICLFHVFILFFGYRGQHLFYRRDQHPLDTSHFWEASAAPQGVA